MYLLVGLGNPGSKHKNNRHNIGFMAVDEIVRRHGFSTPRSRFQSETFEGEVDGEKVLVLKPQTFMNESGRAVGEAVRFYKLSPQDVIVLYDEIDLAAGKVRVKQGGGAAGHNGIRNIVNHLGSPDFVRVRLGVGHPGDKEKVHGHVLGDFSSADRRWVEPFLDAVAAEVPLLIARRDSDFMSRVAQALQPPKPKKQAVARAPEPAAAAQPAPDVETNVPGTALGDALKRAKSKLRGG